MAIISRAAANASRTNFTEWNGAGQLVRIILILALPVTATNALQALISFVDVKMISVLGSEALASMSVGRSSFWLVTSVFMGLGAGITAYVSRLTGAGDHERARAYASIGILTAAVLGLILMLTGLLLGAGPVQYMVTSGGDQLSAASVELTRRYAWDYMRVLLIGLGGMGVQFAAVSVFNSLGRTMYPMWLLVISNIANFLGNWYLIQRMQVAGCALSTTLTFTLSSLVAVWWLTRHGHVVWSRALLFAPLSRAWEMLRLGFPAILQVALRALASLAVIKVITYLPDSVVGQSALLVGLQAESLAFMPAFAFSTSAATLVGQNLGALKPAQARLSTLYCVLFGEVILLTMGSLFFFFPHWFIHLFIGDNAPEVIPDAMEYLRVIALCLPGLGVGMVLNGALRGAGDTKAAAWITVTAMWLVRFPLVVFMAFSNIGGTGLGLGLGLSGIWWGITASVYFEASLAFLRFRSGHWAKVKLKTV